MKSNDNQLICTNDDSNFIEELSKAYMNNRKDKTSLSKELVTLHNSGKIDIIFEFKNIKKSLMGHNFFTIRHIFEDALPMLNASVLDIMDCVKHLTLEAGNDMAAGTTISSFIQYCKEKDNRPAEVLTYALVNVEGSFDFITPAIIAGSTRQTTLFVNKAIELTTHENIVIRERAVYAIGRINYLKNLELIDIALDALELAIKKEYKNSLFSSALKSIFSLYSADNSKEEKTIELVNFILVQKDDLILHTVSDIINYEISKIPESILDIFLDVLINIKPENTGTIQNIDFCLEHLLTHDMFDKAINFIERFLLINNEKLSVSVFTSFTNKILYDSQNQLYKLITRWFLSKKITLCHSAYNLLNQDSSKDIILKVDISQIKDENSDIHVFLAKKACGWFFMQPVSAASFILSLIDVASKNEILLIQNILLNPLLISYPGSVKDHLKKIKEESSDKVKNTITNVLSELDKYHEGLNSVGNITELSPTIAQRETYQRKWNRMMSNAHKNAPKGMLSEIFTKTVLLYGNSSIFYIHHGENDDKTRQEMPMHTFSHSIEFPSLEYLDPHGLDYALRVFKSEGCK